MTLPHIWRLILATTILLTCSCSDIVSAIFPMEAKSAVGVAEENSSKAEEYYNEIVIVNARFEQTVSEIRRSVDKSTELESQSLTKLNKLK